MKFFLTRGYTLDSKHNQSDTAMLADEIVERLNLKLLMRGDVARRYNLEFDSFPATFTDSEKVMWINNVSDAGDVAISLRFADDIYKFDGVGVVYQEESELKKKEAAILARILSGELGIANAGALADEKLSDRSLFTRDLRCRSYVVVIGRSPNQVRQQKDAYVEGLFDAISKVFLPMLTEISVAKN